MFEMVVTGLIGYNLQATETDQRKKVKWAGNGELTELSCLKCFVA